ncbi:hypothetical protein MOQ72_29160 [Saccharopolyspora sp. K220]|uniref:hypothetical protein n=1 Tax=Saccharopolyspora soli TaxID=2926618 RepID=UPI001F5611E1|nr:hypothetical protein [Saccharopolyspora soli]MCI2421511.1 hypothetical protein [Saccharopolyspora soli]
MPRAEFEFRVGESRWVLDFADITMSESVQLEKLTGRDIPGITFPRLAALFTAQSALARRAFFWLARVKSGETVDYDSPVLDVKWSELIVNYLGEDADEQTAATPDPTQETPRTASPTASS